MPISPGKDETQDKWMSRCVPEMMGKDGGQKRPQEQAVAACLTMWRDKDKKKALTNKQNPEPDDDESYDEFLDRCKAELMDDDPDLDEDTAEDRCSVAWEESDVRQRDARRLNRKTHTGTVHGMEFILSDETPDRLGDVVSSGGWDLANFKKNPIALFNHNPSFVIGKWDNLRVEGGALKGRLMLAPKGTSARIDEIRKLVDAGILRAVSVGFRAMKQEPLKSIEGFVSGGLRFLRQELVETSLVSVPANPNALAVAKSLHLSPATLDLVFAKTGNGHGRDAGRVRRQVGRDVSTRTMTMDETTPLGQRIQAAESRLVALQDQLETHLRAINDENVSDADMVVTSELNNKISQEQKTRNMLVESERRLASNTITPDDARVERTDTGLVAAPGITAKHRPWSIAQRKIEPLDYLWRSVAINFLHHTTKHQRALGDLVKERYGDDDMTMALVLRNASAPATMATPTWAQELVQQVWTGFMQALIPYSIYPELARRGQSYTFGQNGVINLPLRQATPSLGGSFVGEGAPIPVRQGAFATAQLTPKKLAVISTFTRELAEHSTPSIEGIIRESIVYDTATAVNAILLDANPATAVRPAGLLNGIAGLTPTAGGGVNAVIGDMKLLINALMVATLGNVRDPVWLMTPANAAAIALTPTTVGVLPFRDEIANNTLMGIPIIKSSSVPLNTLILMDAADFATAADAAPRFDVSDQAVLHMEDTTPAAIVGGTSGAPVPAVPTRSLWQTDTIGVRMLQTMNWIMRRTGMIQWMTGMTWV